MFSPPEASIVEISLTLGELLVGVGTISLAVFTAVLAKRAGHDVEASREGLEVAKNSIEAHDKPFLVASFSQKYPSADMEPVWGEGQDPQSDAPEDFQWVIEADVSNLGRGPAILFGAAAFKPGTESRSDAEWSSEIPIGPGETSSLGLNVNVEPEVGQELSLLLYYRSVSGREYITRHRIYVRRHLFVSRLDIRREEVAPQAS